jgi:hypothetical protein
MKSGADYNRRNNYMRTVRTKVYKFDELTSEAKKKAISQFLDTNVDYDWWKFVYDDAKTIGLKINGFDIGRGNYCKGELINSAIETANLIKLNHGDNCETYKTAVHFISQWNELVQKHSDGITLDKVSEENEYEFDKEVEGIENDFTKSICEDYRIILQKEYEYLTSEEAIIESIISNEYEFTKGGKQWY